MDVLLAVVPPLAEAIRQAAQEGQTTFAITDDGMKFLGAGLAMGLGAFGPAMAIGNQ